MNYTEIIRHIGHAVSYTLFAASIQYSSASLALHGVTLSPYELTTGLKLRYAVSELG